MSTPAPRFVYFDVASTLLEKRDLIATLASVFARAGQAIDEPFLRERHKILTEVLPFPDKTTRAFYDDFNARLCFALGVVPTEALLADCYASCRALPWVAFDDVDVLSRFTCPLGILSNWDTSLESKLLAAIGENVRFARVVGSETVGVAKPDPRIFTHALRDLGCAPHEVLFVGDSLRLDIAPALAQGIDAVLLDRHDTFPTYRGRRVRSLRELVS